MRLAVASLLLVAAALTAQAADSACPAEAEVWLAELRSGDFAARSAATDRLIAAGPCVVLKVAALTRDADPEVAWRAEGIVQAIAMADEASLAIVTAALEGNGYPSFGQKLKALKQEQDMIKSSPWLQGLIPGAIGLRMYGC